MRSNSFRNNHNYPNVGLALVSNRVDIVWFFGSSNDLRSTASLAFAATCSHSVTHAVILVRPDQIRKRTRWNVAVLSCATVCFLQPSKLSIAVRFSYVFFFGIIAVFWNLIAVLQNRSTQNSPAMECFDGCFSHLCRRHSAQPPSQFPSSIVNAHMAIDMFLGRGDSEIHFPWFCLIVFYERGLLPALESRLSSCSCILWEINALHVLRGALSSWSPGASNAL